MQKQQHWHSEKRCTARSMDRRLLNIIQVGFGFILIFTAFLSCSTIQSNVIESLIKETNSTSELGGLSKSSGYIGQAIVYAFFTFGNFLTPAIIYKIGPRLGMVFGSLAYVLYLASFLKLQGWFLYACSAIVGLGAALLWPSQGAYVTANSDETTIARNSGITWAMAQCSLLFGSLFLYFQFRGQDVITDDMRQVIYITFACICGLGVLVFVFLQNTPAEFTNKESNAAKGIYNVANGAQSEAFNSDVQCLSVKVFQDCDSAAMPQGIQHSDIRFYGKINESKHMCPSHERRSFIDNFLSTFKLLTERDIQLLSPAFIFVGFDLCFYLGVYGTCLSNTNYFSSEANAMLGLSGIFIGLGAITGGTAFGIFGKKTLRYSRMPIIALGMVSHLSAYTLTFLNIPARAPLGDTYDTAYITPNKPLAIFCAFCFGFGDVCWLTQIYSILATLVPHNSARGFALFQFFKSLSCAIAFFYASVLLLHWQLLILVITCVMGGSSFLVVEYKVFYRRRSVVETTSGNKCTEG